MFVSFGVAATCVAAVLLAAPLTGSARAADDQEDPIVAFARPRLKDPNKPFTLIVGVKIKDGMQDKFEAAFAKAIKGTRQEKGCIAYDLNRDSEDPTRYQVYERWKSLADLDAHLKTDHIKTLRSELAGVTVGDRDLRIMIPAGE